MRALAIVIILMLGNDTASASKIDSLLSKKDVKQFLADSFSKQELVYANEYASLSQAQMKKAHLLQLPKTYYDTVQVEDPVSGKMFLKVIEQQMDSACHCCDRNANNRQSISYRSVTDLINYRPFHFYKTDIDGNGCNDLIVEADATVVVLDLAGILEGHVLSMQADTNADRQFILAFLPDGNTGLLIRSGACEEGNSGYKKIDTVVYKYGSFVKYNPSYKPSAILKIRYQFVQEYGTMCDGYTTMEINKDGSCFLNYSHYNTLFSGYLHANEMNELWGLVGYVDVKFLEDSYTDGSVDTDGCVLTVYYDDGTMKRINVRNCSPSISFNYLTRRIADISMEIEWKVTGVVKDFDSGRVMASPISLGEQPSNACGCSW